VDNSLTGTFHSAATASSRTRRAWAPARRSGLKKLRVVRLPAMIWAPPKPGLPYTGFDGGGTTFTFVQSASSSSATTTGMPVMDPCPISTAAETIVIVSSGLIVTQMFGDRLAA